MSQSDDLPMRWPEQGVGNCDDVAEHVQAIVGGRIRVIRALSARPRLGRSLHDPDGAWSYHTVVVNGDTVFDAFRGPGGLPSSEYKALFDEHDEIDFGF